MNIPYPTHFQINTKSLCFTKVSNIWKFQRVLDHIKNSSKVKCLRVSQCLIEQRPVYRHYNIWTNLQLQIFSRFNILSQSNISLTTVLMTSHKDLTTSAILLFFLRNPSFFLLQIIINKNFHIGKSILYILRHFYNGLNKLLNNFAFLLVSHPFQFLS